MALYGAFFGLFRIRGFAGSCPLTSQRDDAAVFVDPHPGLRQNHGGFFLSRAPWSRFGLVFNGPWARSSFEDDLVDRTGIGLSEAPVLSSRADLLIRRPRGADLAVRAVLQHVHPAFEFKRFEHLPFGRVAYHVLPEGSEYGLRPNPNLCSMCLLLLRRESVESCLRCDLVHRLPPRSVSVWVVFFGQRAAALVR